MRVSNLSWGLCATLLMAGAAHAERTDRQLGTLDDSPRFMLYVTKHIGATRRQSLGPSFGFAVEREMPLRLQTDPLSLRPASVKIFDMRFTAFDGGGALFVNGMHLTGKVPQGLGFESYGEGESWDNPWLWGGLGLAALLGISCATDNWPCDDGGYGGDDDYTPPGE
jgi:hypothetical protein